MGLLVNSTDFVGEFAIPQDQYTKTALDLLITQTEQNYIYTLLGAELGQLFIDNVVSGVPQTQIYLDIYNSFVKDSADLVVSTGMKDMILRFIFFDWTRRIKYDVGITGLTEKRSTNSVPAKYDSSWLIRVYNMGIDTHRAIQWYVLDNSVDYPTFKGKQIGYSLGW